MTAPKRAKRQHLIAAIEIAGPSGAGKTLGGLLIAYGMMKEKYPEIDEFDLWGKIGLIDTEHDRSLVYEGMEYQGVHVGQFWHQPLENDYTVSRYETCVKDLKKVGCEVVVVDSISHAWDGSGGILDLQQAKGGTFQSWRDVNPDYNRFIKLVTGETYRMHTISTVRQKQEYAMEQSETGKLKVTKLGLKHVQRDSLEYEFQVVFNVDMNHQATTTKDNSSLFEGKQAPLGPDHGKKLIQWLEKGEDVKGKEEEQRQEFIKMVEELAASKPELDEKLKELEKRARMTLDQFDIRLAERAFGILNQLMMDLELKETELKEAQAQ